MTEGPSSITILIPGRPPGPNDTRRMHWAAERKIQGRWRQDAKNIALDLVNRLGWRKPDRARLTMTFLVPDHGRRDWDNLISSTKPLTDGLVDAGVIRDDSTAVLEPPIYALRVTPGYAGTEYLVERAEGTEDLGL